MSYTLTDAERHALQTVRESGTPAEIRRAQIILMSADDTPTAEIAAAVELSAGQVRRWRREWQERGLGIFPDLDAPADSLDASEAVVAAIIDDEFTALESAFDDVVAAVEEPGDGDLESALDDAFDTDEASAEESEPEPEPAPEPVPGVDVPRLPLDLRESVGILPGDAMAEAGRKALFFHFERMLKHEPGSRLGVDIEAVHDMRVATRRMRSAFRLFKPFYKKGVIHPYLDGLRRVGDALGEVRDLDVAIEKAGRFQADHPDLTLDPLLTAWNKRRSKARRTLITRLDSKDFARFVDKFHTFLTTPGKGAKPIPSDAVSAYQVRHIAPRLIYAHYEQVRAYDTVLDGAPIETLHALRIDFKRFRYALEFFADVLGPEARQVIEDVKIMQDHLGDLNDACVAADALRDFVDAHHVRYSGVPLFMRPDISGVLAYAAAQQDEQRRLLDTFPAAWEHFNRARLRRDLALAVAAL
ncbi:MAG: CHAD domain-containing protein [Anaerolineae bacterium]|nr:CHAD domain-containing protein [Anaerolineae bacterium]